MADQQPNDAADERQNQPRRGLEGKGFDAGTGYGGAGNSALYNGESAYGGQSAQANNSLGGAYRGEGYGRPGDDDPAAGDEPAADAAQQGGGQNVGRDTDGRGSANQPPSVSTPRGPDEQAVNEAFEGRGRQPRGPDAIDLQDMNGASRREPGR
jgi:hypothetical protein